jgi:aqualysin 1
MRPHNALTRAFVVIARAKRAALSLTVAGAMLLACAGAVLAQAPATPTSPKPAAGSSGVPNHYIVVLKDDTDHGPEQVANEHARHYGSQVRHVYQNALKGYAAVIPNERIVAVRNDERVDYVEPDQEVRTTDQTLPWGIDKIDADTSSAKAGNGSGAVWNVNAYIIDTGVYSHTDLSVVDHVNFAGGQNTDCNGHGTHVAGTVAAKDNARAVVGSAPGAPLTGVKVIGCDGTGLASDVIEGVDWVTANAKKPAIANMSLGGEASYAMDRAVQNSANSGIFYAVSAGNGAADACNYSPARAGAGTSGGILGILGAGTDNGILTVAATDKGDAEASFSNYGKCVDLWAPGVGALSTQIGGGTTTMSGTSMASPHVGGSGALYLSRNPMVSAAMVESQLKTDSIVTGTKSKDGGAIKRLYAGKY